MKQFILLLLSVVVALTMFSACNDEEDDDLLGTWKTENRLADIKIKDGKAEAEIKDVLEKNIFISSMWETYVFNKNGKGYYMLEEGWGQDDFTYSVKGNELTIKAKYDLNNNETGVFTYSIASNSLTLITDLKPLMTAEYLKRMGIKNPESIEVERAIFTRTLIRK